MNKTNPSHTASAACTDGCGDLAISEPSAVAEPTGTVTLRIANMDCASEESEIRRALEPIGDLDTLRFDLGRRTLSLGAQGARLDQAMAAICKAGFQPEVIGTSAAGTGEGGAQGDASGSR